MVKSWGGLSEAMNEKLEKIKTRWGISIHLTYEALLNVLYEELEKVIIFIIIKIKLQIPCEHMFLLDFQGRQQDKKEQLSCFLPLIIIPFLLATRKDS